MALIKSWPDPTGTVQMPAAYIRWAAVEIRPIERVIRAAFNVYRDQAARDADKPPVDTVGYGLAGDAYDAFTGGQSQAADSIGALVYGFAKVQPDMDGAIDA